MPYRCRTRDRPPDPTGAAAVVITRSSIAWFAEIATSLSQLASLVATADMRDKQHDRSSC
jgi:hypothetical protein